MKLTPAVRAEYEHLFVTLEVGPEWAHEVARAVDLVAAGEPRYRAVAAATGVGWHVIGVIHQLEASADWRCHLHNGDPLTRRTRRVPAGRPVDGEPPFTWEQSAVDAVRHAGLDRRQDWSIGGSLHALEEYNGFGYRRLKRPISTPYLYSGSTHYVTGKYVADGRYDPLATSQQLGAAVLLHEMMARGLCLIPAGEICGAISAEGYTCVRGRHLRTAAHRDELGLAWRAAS